jgi:hypothetical protein
LVADCIARAAAGKPWLEKTLWGLRDQEGGWIGAEIRNRDGSHDLGPLQVNSWWVPRIAGVTHKRQDQVRYWLKNDACFNVETARWIFLSALRDKRNYWTAIGAYHSEKRSKQDRYASAVSRHLRRRFGSKIFSGAQDPAASRDR